MKKYLIILAIFITIVPVLAQNKDQKNPLRWRISMGLNFGATSPIPTPKEITKVYVWYPNINPSFSLMGVQNFNEKDGLGFIFTMEKKSFGATTNVEKLSINVEGEKMFFSGDQNTSFDARYVGSAIVYTRNFLDNKINVYTGLSVNFLIGSDFIIKLDGDGTISNETDSSPLNSGTIVKRTFNDYINPTELGFVIGSDFFFTKNLGVTLRFNAGLTNATKEEFTNMTGQSLRSLYGFLGLNYRFN